MTILSDAALAELYPEYKGVPGPASIDLHVGDALLAWPDYVCRDPRIDQAERWKRVETEDRDGPVWVLEPGIRYLAATAESIRIPNDCAGQVAARSSWGRDGLSVICGPAGFLDPGFSGKPTLELSVTGSDLIVWPGAVICQLVMFHLDGPCRRPYEGKYQGNTLPTPSRLHQEVTRP